MPLGWPNVRLSRLRPGEWIVTVAGVVTLISLFALPWFRLYPGAPTQDGWNGFLHGRWMLAATLILACGLFWFQATRRSPAIPVTLGLFATLFAAVSALWLIYRLLIDPPHATREAGGFVALASMITLAYGGWRSIRDERVAPADRPSEIPTVDPEAAAHS